MKYEKVSAYEVSFSANHFVRATNAGPTYIKDDDVLQWNALVPSSYLLIVRTTTGENLKP
jgi:hypothetical protein